MQIIISGLIMGCIYALVALGLVLIYKTTDVVNFAQGEMAMVTTFVSYVFLTSYGFPYLVTLLLSLLFAIVFGITVYVIFMKKILSAPHLNQVVLTLGLFMVFNGMAGIIWGHQAYSFAELNLGNHHAHLDEPEVGACGQNAFAERPYKMFIYLAMPPVPQRPLLR